MSESDSVKTTKAQGPDPADDAASATAVEEPAEAEAPASSPDEGAGEPGEDLPAEDDVEPGAVEEPAEAEAPASSPEEGSGEPGDVAAEEDVEAGAVEEVGAAEVVALASSVARVYLCECGYRTYAIWSEPTVCRARPTRHGPECGKPLYPMNELPDQVRKALNPLKASRKKAAGA